MFGYIKPLECELKVREMDLYRAYYCGLCKTIGKRYGILPRLLLNYDCTFLACLLSEMSGDPVSAALKCARHPFRRERRYVAPNGVLCYAADVNVLLALEKLEDDWRDERKLGARLARLLLGRTARRAKANHPALAEAIALRIGQLSAVEKRNAACTDEPSGAFGDLMQDIARLAPGLPERNRAACEWMLYNLGRWVYLIDAWEDRGKDGKKGAYNPFLTAQMTREDASFLLYVSLSEAEKAYDLIDFAVEHGVTDNIMQLGCRQVTRLLLEKENPDESL